MIPKNFDDITKDDIEDLISSKVGESKKLEFKRQLPSNSDRDKRKFLAGVSAFANTSGGDMIFGISEEKDGDDISQTCEISPITDVSIDEVKRYLESLIRNCITPKIYVQIKEIIGFGNDGKGCVVLVRIPKSCASPHMVTFNKHISFYIRTSSGADPIRDVYELRSAFLANESQAEKIKNFLFDRISQIVADELPLNLCSNDRIVLHVIPMNHYLDGTRIPLGNWRKLQENFAPMYRHNDCQGRYSLDGYITYHDEAACTVSYCQMFTNGVIEAVNSKILYAKNNIQYLPSDFFEMQIIKSLERYIEGIKKFDIDQPVAISVALLGCKGFAIGNFSEGRFDRVYPVDKNILMLPNVIIDDLNCNLPLSLKPIFDSLWNACGFEGSRNYSGDIWKLRDRCDSMV